MEKKDLKEVQSQGNDSIPDEKLTSEKHVDSEDHKKNNFEEKISSIEKESTDVEKNDVDKDDGATVYRTLYICDVPGEERENKPVFYGTENPEAVTWK